nr:XRE family transcriptional regulator [Variovorax paradoxus]
MNQLEFPLMGRIDAPSVAPQQWVRAATSYREAVRLCWRLRRVAYMTRQQLASEAELYPQHVTDYLHEDDKPSRRDLPASAVARFEAVVGNTLISQWLAAQSKLTVLEEMTATRAFA